MQMRQLDNLIVAQKENSCTVQNRKVASSGDHNVLSQIHDNLTTGIWNENVGLVHKER